MSEINNHCVFNFFQNNEKNTKTTYNLCLKEYDILLNKSTAKSYISLFDSPEDIQKKILSAETDSGKDVLYNVTKKPGISNILTRFLYKSRKSKDTAIYTALLDDI